MSEYIHKSHNVTILLYHLVFPAKYRRAVFDNWHYFKFWHNEYPVRLRRGFLFFEYDGEMNSDVALNSDLRDRLFPNSRFHGSANVLVYGNSDAAGAARNILKEVSKGLEVGPILMGMGNRAHIVTPSVTARGLLNTTALAGTAVVSYG